MSATSLITDSFDARQGPYAAANSGVAGSVGSNGNVHAQGVFSIGGSVWVSSSSGLDVGAAAVLGELQVAGRTSFGGSASVRADAFVAGDLVTQGDLTVGGTLHQPSGSQVSASVAESLGGRVVESVQVPPACDCTPSPRLEVSSLVEAHRATNDDAAAGTDPAALTNVSTDTTLSFPCGDLFFSQISGSTPIHLVLAAGHTSLFVGGDVSLGASLAIDVPQDGELDLFIEGNVTASSTVTLGDPAHAAHTRVWVGGTGTVNLSGMATWSGELYAPQAELLLGGAPVTVFGSVFVRRLALTAPLTVHYDESVLAAGATCEATAGTALACASCLDCGNGACVAGACAACTDSTQCCAPLVCQGGACVGEIR